jgi:hypothetical protein
VSGNKILVSMVLAQEACGVNKKMSMWNFGAIV